MFMITLIEPPKRIDHISISMTSIRDRIGCLVTAFAGADLFLNLFGAEVRHLQMKSKGVGPFKVLSRRPKS